ncbi:MAG TPA: malto-oligosyltrehalose trehalohydrolase [Burkholderiales bacterium]|nr:malto-oligosyltrehalose trehalohydrolase [Burkholderiales bacterium]
MRRRHAMPFGCELLPGGGARFRLWAPGARAVTLRLHAAGEQPQEAAAAALGQGWFEAERGRARAGDRYQFVIDGDLAVPDPAARWNPEDVHGASAIVDPLAFDWQDTAWRGRPWHEVVLYEVHVGTFSPEGTFAGVEQRLDHLVALGVTAIEIMPVADFPGARDWGYDGALLFSPDAAYGTPDDLKRLVQAAHARGLMVFLDVVYNHFGPEGNYLYVYARQFFTERHHTPWGGAIDFEGPASRTVRDFYVHNALYWIEEFHIDGLRLDAVHAIYDASRPDILVEIAAAVRAGPGADRHVHLVLENDDNAARYLCRGGERDGCYDAQWNDDIHHALHVLLTGESEGYYADYADDPLAHLGRCLAEGFAYQGERSPYRDGQPRGEASASLPATAFVSFLQNHDQIGNRAFGERLAALAAPERLAAAVAVVLLAPSPPLLFMGEEWGSTQPFLFFCDFEPTLAPQVTAGRRREFERFPRFRDEAARERIPDPAAAATFASSKLDWEDCQRAPGTQWLALYRQLLALRRAEIVPRLPGMHAGGRWQRLQQHGLAVDWQLGDGSRLHLVCNLSDLPLANVALPRGRLLHATHSSSAADIPPWSAAWLLEAPDA